MVFSVICHSDSPTPYLLDISKFFHHVNADISWTQAGNWLAIMSRRKQAESTVYPSPTLGVSSKDPSAILGHPHGYWCSQVAGT